MVTFGEMAALAHHHLDKIDEFLQLPDFGTYASHPSTAAELAGMCRVLGRYTDRIATGFGIPSTDESGVRDAARQVGALLQEAGQALGGKSEVEPHGPPLTQLLRATSTVLGCGLDLLSTHFTPATRAADTPPNSIAAVIAAADSARPLLHMLSGYSAAAGQVAMYADPSARPAALPLLKAARIAQEFGHTNSTGITAIPLRSRPDRIRPEIGEDREQALAGIDASIRRLDAPESSTSVTTWRYLARATAVATGVSQPLLGVLSVRVDQLGDGASAAELAAAAQSLGPTAHYWKNIAKRWHDLTAVHQDPANTVSVDASDLIVRLGRIVYADPAWTPTRRARLEPARPERLAAGIRDARELGFAVLKSTKTFSALAAQHKAAVQDVAAHGLLHEGRSQASQRTVSRLLDLYADAHAAGQTTLAKLGQALRTLTPDPTDEMALALRQAVPGSPTALANADTPHSITEALQMAPGHQPRALSSSPAGGRTRTSPRSA